MQNQFANHSKERGENAFTLSSTLGKTLLGLAFSGLEWRGRDKSVFILLGLDINLEFILFLLYVK